MRNILLMLMLSLFAISCSQTVQVKHEAETKTGKIEEVPKWFIEKSDDKGFLGSKEKFYIYNAMLQQVLTYNWQQKKQP